MALPQVANNTPSAGRIAWLDFNIAYEGVGYHVLGGNTAARWVWWRFNNGSPVLESGAVIPDDLTSDDLVLLRNKDGIALRVQSSNFIDGELIVDGSILAEAIAVNQLNSQHIVTEGLDAGVIKFGTMNGNRIAVNTLYGNRIVASSIAGDRIIAETITAREIATDAITANKVAAKAIDVSKLNVGDLTNYVADGSLSDPTLANWDNNGGYLERVDPANASPYLSLTTSAVADTFFSNKRRFPAIEGDEFYLSFEVSTPSTNTETVQLCPGLEVFNADGVSMLWRLLPEDALVAPNTSWTLVSGTLGSDFSQVAAAAFNPFVKKTQAAGQKIYIRNMTVRRRFGGQLIVDGSIKARHLEIESVAAEVVNAGVLQSQLSITGNLAIADSKMGWSKSQGLYIGDDVAFYDDGRTSRLEGDVVTESLSVKDGFSLGGNADIHGTVIAANGISTPTAKMGLSQTWLSHPTTGTAASGGLDNSTTTDWSTTYNDIVEYGANHWLVAINYFGTALRKYKKTGGFDGDLPLGAWASKFSPVGLCVIGTNVWLLGTDQNREGGFYIYRIDSAGNKVAERYITSNSGFGSRRPKLVTDGTNIGMVWTALSSGVLALRWHNQALSATVGNDIQLATNVGVQHIGGVHYGIGQSGGPTRLWVSLHTGDSNMVRCYTTAGVKVPAEDFPRAFDSSVIGLSYDTGLNRLVTVDKYTRMYLYSDYIDGGTLNAQYTYYDGDSSNYPSGTVINGVDKSGQASGPHETAPSPVTSFALSRRAYPSITAPPAPDELVTDVNQVDKADRLGIYAAVGGTPMFQGYLGKGVRTLPTTGRLLTAAPAAGNSSVPSFATAAVPAPGKFQSSAQSAGGPTWMLPGSGGGRVGPHRWDDSSRPLNHGEWVSSTSQTSTAGAWVKRTGWVVDDNSIPVSGITHDGAGNFTVSQSGLYLICASLAWAGSAAGRRIVGVYVGANERFTNEGTQPAAAQPTTPNATKPIYLAAGSVVSVQGFQTGGNTTYLNVAARNYLGIYCLAAF